MRWGIFSETHWKTGEYFDGDASEAPDMTYEAWGVFGADGF